MFYKKDSKWHHEITHFPYLTIDDSIHCSDKIDNFCSYTRWFLWKLLVVIPLVVLLVGGFLGWWISGLAAFLTPSIRYSVGGCYEIWVITQTIALGIATCICFDIYILDRYRRYRRTQKNARRNEPKEPDGFLTTWYKSFKGKYCPKMEYPNDPN